MQADTTPEWAHVTEALENKRPTQAPGEEDTLSTGSFRTADDAASVSSFMSANSRFSVMTASSFKSC
eukprot:scaffold485223_cov34-Prasinocladus_malaysianus.AAC.1